VGRPLFRETLRLLATPLDRSVLSSREATLASSSQEFVSRSSTLIFGPAERPYGGFYPSTLDSSEIVLRTDQQIGLLNQFITGRV
jgi:hypothetical protein